MTINELIKLKKQKESKRDKLNHEIIEINNKIKQICPHEIILIKDIDIFDEKEYMCILCNKFLHKEEIPETSKVITLEDYYKHYK